MVEIEELLNVPIGTIVEDALVVLAEMMAPGDVAVEFEFAPSMVTPLLGALELPRTMLCPLIAVVPLELEPAWLAVVVSLVVESSVSVSEVVLVTPGSAAMVDPEVTKLAVLDPVVELTPILMPVVELAAGAVLESEVL